MWDNYTPIELQYIGWALFLLLTLVVLLIYRIWRGDV